MRSGRNRLNIAIWAMISCSYWIPEVQPFNIPERQQKEFLFSSSTFSRPHIRASTRLDVLLALPFSRQGGSDTVINHQRRGGSSSSSSKQSQQRWHQGFIQRVFRRGDRQQLQAASVATLSLDEKQQDVLRSNIIFSYQEHHLPDVLVPWQRSSPNSPGPASFLSPLLVVPPATTTMPNQKGDTDISTTHAPPTPMKQQEGFMTRALRTTTESTLESLLLRWCNGEVNNLNVHCEPKSSVFGLAKGLFRCDATVDCDFIKFPCIQFSGGRLSTQRLALNVYSFSALKHLGTHRFPNQFDFEATDVVFTANDLFVSNCIRNGLAHLLTRILRGRGMTASKVRTQAIEISNEGKLSFRGRVVTGFTDVAFEVRTGLGTAARGHVLTFPGLEVSLSPAMGIFFPVPDISVDLGYNSQIHKLELHPSSGLHISCQSTVTPHHTLTTLLQYAQTTKAYAAPFAIDVARWLTQIGNFSV
jgi:hypothetical protein